MIDIEVEIHQIIRTEFGKYLVNYIKCYKLGKLSTFKQIYLLNF